MSKASNMIAAKTSNFVGQADPVSSYKVVLNNLTPIQNSRQQANLLVGTDFTVGMSEAFDDNQISMSRSPTEQKMNPESM